MPLPLSLAGVDGPVFHTWNLTLQCVELLICTLLMQLKLFLVLIVMHMLMLLYDMW